MKIIVDVPKQDYIYVTKKHCLPSCDERTLREVYYKMLLNSVPLEEIRAEIEASKWTNKYVRIERNTLASGLDTALEIIDKYKSESEVKE